MSPASDRDRELGGDDALAAEYVLGVLSQVDRQIASERIERDRDFARLVDAWEARLSPLAEGYAEATPPAAVETALRRRLFAENKPARGGLWQSLALWRSLSAAAVAGLALFLAIQFTAPPQPPEAGDMLVASLAPQGTDVAYYAMYDPRSRELGLSHVAGERTQGHDFELWVIEGQNAPRSLGVIPVGASMRMPVAQDLQTMIGSGATFAISMEPAGGSPSGTPTGPVVAADSLRPI